MKFQLDCLGVCLIFYTYNSANFKSIGNNTIEKMLYSLLRWPCLLQDVLNRRLLFKQTGSSSTKGNHHPSFLRFWNWAKKTVDTAKLWRREKMLKRETSKHS